MILAPLKASVPHLHSNVTSPSVLGVIENSKSVFAKIGAV